MNAYQELDEHLVALFRIMDLLVPNSIPSDIDRIEANIEDIKLMYEKAIKLRIFGRLEKLLFESGEENTKRLVYRILHNIEENKEEWDNYYNRKTFLKAEYSVFLYRDVEMKYIIRRTNSLIKNTLYEIRNFNDNYFNPKIQSSLLERLSESETSIKASIIIDNHQVERVDESAFCIKEERITRFISNLLSIEFEFLEDCVEFPLEKIISKYDSNERDFPKFEDRVFLTFDNFEKNETQFFEKLGNLKDEIVIELQNQSIEIGIWTIGRLDALMNNMTAALTGIMESHISFMNNKINAKELWVKVESLFRFPESDKVIIQVDLIKYLVIALIKRKEFLNSLVVEINAIVDKLINKETNSSNLIHGPKKKTRTPDPRPFPEHLNYKDQEELAKALRNSFDGKKGKFIRLMFEGLKRNNCITLNSGEFKDHILSFRDYVSWDIGSYQSIQNYVFSLKTVEEKLLKEAEDQIRSIIQSIEKKQ